MTEQKLEKFNKIFPWYSGLSADLLFWVAIDTLFLTVVKKLNPAQITSLTTISLIVCIALQVPLLKMIKNIGNTNSVKLGSLLLLIASILLTFGNSYIIIVLGRIFKEIAATFQNISNVILKNNLELLNKSENYMKIRGKSNTIYATVTMIISFIASIMFNINNYLPMLGCILFCFICYILSFKIIDYSKYDKTEEKSKTKKVKMKYSWLIIVVFISYGLFYPVVNSGQENGKLFIQQELLKNFDVEKTALIIGGILCISRIIRVISNIAFDKIYKKLKDKVTFVLAILLASAIGLILIGSFISSSLALKFGVMSFGYIIILFIRDPFKIYMQNLALNNVDKEEQNTVITILELSRKIGRAIISLGFTLILLKKPMILVIAILFILAIIEILVSIKLYNLIMKSKLKVDHNFENYKKKVEV